LFDSFHSFLTMSSGASGKNMTRKHSLLNRKTMDGPTVPWTVADLFKANPRWFMAYHTMGAGYDFLTPIGTLLGGGLYTAGWRPYPSVLAMMGTSGLVAGGAGMMLGMAALANTARKGEDNTPLPWNDECIQMRVNGLSHNFMVRVMDLSVWSGLGVAAGVLMFKGGPAAFGSLFSKGTLGTMQLLSLGAAAGGLSGIACVAVTKRKEIQELDTTVDE
jgi:hypothetical protein